MESKLNRAVATTMLALLIFGLAVNASVIHPYAISTEDYEGKDTHQ